MSKYSYDIVGSFLRPKKLKEARAKFTSGEISAQDLKEIEDECIKELVEKEKELNLPFITDGEFRREYWHLDFLSFIGGIKRVKASKWSVEFKGNKPKANTIVIEDKIHFDKSHPFLNHFKFLANLTQNAKMTIPSPSMLHLIPCVREENYEPIEIYAKDDNQIYKDIANTYIDAMKEFYKLGCKHLQLDDTSWGEFCDAEKVKAYEARGVNLEKIKDNYVWMLNEIVKAKPDDMIVSVHVCRGNFRSTWFSSGGYESVAKVLFGKCNVDMFFLEYDNDRSGGFEPLRYIKDQKVVLGLITSKFPELEDKDSIKARVKEAIKFVSLDQLLLSTQCGFSSTEEGNELSEDEQWAKIRLVQELAKEIWGE
ncbi:5-methyltetrahydropteroyltriglutamate--homocysteine S-methyltransferase [Campylobacter corcagiensis]|uniref:5-methyltetrahydropteroyltriglutamate--homocysteine S-methyltransferase n=1 Tax=Campylobacter corcagiensis TaxID=1448857 RepID=A0A7M1LG11_9BACT|nr:5-methyltetrahydropteroyltriglutamate--homocysteine S-methyltransferase [Campylobacter corcagiensis]QKF64444.1 cobalamin-independent methionine synthase, C-terminal domain-like protein [Campylobacter corcagiensis]QOQ87370.1 5-methyltetrahydropteroyltriglutamate--homocysteine S-methyltransferase [Campylobacter corcagiensis]